MEPDSWTDEDFEVVPMFFAAVEFADDEQSYEMFDAVQSVINSDPKLSATCTRVSSEAKDRHFVILVCDVEEFVQAFVMWGESVAGELIEMPAETQLPFIKRHVKLMVEATENGTEGKMARRHMGGKWKLDVDGQPAPLNSPVKYEDTA